MPIREASSMDRPVSRRRPPYVRWIGLAAGLVLLTLLARPFVARWLVSDRSVAREQLRYGTASQGDLVHTVAVEGKVVAASRPTLFSPVAGIVSVRVDEGQRVTAGEVLAVVESPEVESRQRQEQAGVEALESDVRRLELEARRRNLENQQAVELAEVRSAAAGRLVERNEHLHGLGLVNAIDLEASRDAQHIAALEQEQARQRLVLERDMLRFEVQDATLRLERQRLVAEDYRRRVEELNLAAPFDGLVATLSVEDRDAVVRGQALVGIVDLSHLEVEVGIPESAADEVSPGVLASMSIDGEDRTGSLMRIAPEVRGGQVTGRVAFSGGVPEGLRQNQRVPTRLLLDHRVNVLKVPRGPFLEDGGGRSVYVVEDGMAIRRAIEVGAVSVSEVEILSGLQSGDVIVLSDMSRFDGSESVLIRD